MKIEVGVALREEDERMQEMIIGDFLDQLNLCAWNCFAKMLKFELLNCRLQAAVLR